MKSCKTHTDGRPISTPRTRRADRTRMENLVVTAFSGHWPFCRHVVLSYSRQTDGGHRANPTLVVRKSNAFRARGSKHLFQTNLPSFFFSKIGVARRKKMISTIVRIRPSSSSQIRRYRILDCFIAIYSVTKSLINRLSVKSCVLKKAKNEIVNTNVLQINAITTTRVL